MEQKVIERENSLHIPVSGDVKTLRVELGWKPKDALLLQKVKDAIQVAATGDAENVHDLDLAAVIQYDGDKKADLVFHGKGFSYDKAESVVLGADVRTGMKKGADEQLSVHLKKIPADVRKILFLVNLHEGAEDKKYLGDVNDVFVQIQADGKTIYTETEAFQAADAKEATSLVFAGLCRQDDGWAICGLTRYSTANEAQDIYEGLVGEPFRA